MNQLKILFLLVALSPLNVVAAVDEHHDIINDPQSYPAHYYGKTQPIFWPRASAHSAEDIGYYPDDEDLMILPGTKHTSRPDTAVIVGRWKDVNGFSYVIINAGYPSRVIPLRTRHEFDSFIINYVSRHPEISVCPLTDVNMIACLPQAHAHAPFSPDPATICTGTPFTQTASCRHTQQAVGTKIDGACHVHGTFSPDPLYFCTTDTFTQTATCGHTRTVTGTAYCPPPVPTPPPPPPVPAPPPPPPTCEELYSAAVCAAYQGTYGREPETGGGEYWVNWLATNGDEDFQEAFEAGCQGDDCETLANNNEEDSRGG